MRYLENICCNMYKKNYYFENMFFFKFYVLLFKLNFNVFNIIMIIILYYYFLIIIYINYLSL